jgi:quercetin dioxygenase-like cupin family protein
MHGFYRQHEHEWEDLGAGIARRLIGHTPELMCVLVRFDKGAIGTAHSHLIHDQIAYVVAGRFEIEVDGVKSILSAGDAYIAPKTIHHGAVALEQDSMLLDTFSPRREDFLTTV